MPDVPLDLTAFLMIIVPGAITVWSFRHFTNSNKTGDFEYLTLSIFWGVVLLAIQPWVSEQENLAKLLSNPFATMLAMAFFGTVLSFCYASGSWLGPKVADLIPKLRTKKAKRSRSK